MELNDLYEIILILSSLVHIYFSNLLLGGVPIMVMTFWLGGREGQAHLADLAQKMNRGGPVVMGVAITLGFLSLLVIYAGYENHLMNMLGGFKTGQAILLILLLLAFGGIYADKAGDAILIRTPISRLWIGGMNLICLFGITLLFGASHIMMMSPGYINLVLQEGLHASLNLPTVWPRFFHVLLGSVASTGIVITLYGTLRPYRRNSHASSQDRLMPPFDVDTTRYGVAWTLGGTLPQIVVGPWLLLALPPEVRDRLVDGASLSSFIFFLSLTFALLALVLLNASLMVPHIRGLVWSGVGSLFLTIVLMVMVREEVRVAWINLSPGVKAASGLSGGVVLGVITITLLGLLATSRCIGFLPFAKGR